MGIALHGGMVAIPKLLRERRERSDHNQFRLGTIVGKVEADFIGEVVFDWGEEPR